MMKRCYSLAPNVLSYEGCSHGNELVLGWKVLKTTLVDFSIKRIHGCFDRSIAVDLNEDKLKQSNKLNELKADIIKDQLIELENLKPPYQEETYYLTSLVEFDNLHMLSGFLIDGESRFDSLLPEQAESDKFHLTLQSHTKNMPHAMIYEDEEDGPCFYSTLVVDKKIMEALYNDITKSTLSYNIEVSMLALVYEKKIDEFLANQMGRSFFFPYGIPIKTALMDISLTFNK